MTAVLVSVADAIKGELETPDLGIPISPERSYAEWDIELQDLGTLRVDVVPVFSPNVADMGTRGSYRYVAPVDIGIRKRFTRTEYEPSTGKLELSDVDNLVELVEAIHEHFADGHALAAYPSARWQESKIVASYVKKHLRELRQFTGIVRVTYAVHKDF